MARRANGVVRWTVGVCALAIPAMAWGAALTPGDILVSVGTTASSPANTLYEYTPGGAKVQSFAVPSPNTDDHELRDVTVGPDGKVYLFNGTFAPYLTVLDPKTTTYAHYQGVGFSTAGNVTYGGVAATGSYAFVGDMNTNDSPATGIVRFNLTDFSSQRFASSKEYSRVSIGADQLLYALTTDPTSSWPAVEVYNPATMSLVRTVVFENNDIRAVAAAASGQMYCAGWDGFIYQYDAAGKVVNSRDTGLNNVYDIDLSPDGKIVASDWGHVVLTGTTLASQTTWTLPNTGPVFVAFTTPVPEPGCATLLLLAATLACRRPRKPAL